MNRLFLARPSCRAVLAMLAVAMLPAVLLADETTGLNVGDATPSTELKNLKDETVSLAKLNETQPVVVVFLRGYPGYQCPLCTRQVGQFIAAGDKIKSAGARVLMIYPGTAEKLKEHAADFIDGKNLPDHFDLVVDPDFAATNAWKVRWDAPNETAYPSTFISDTANKIVFAKVSPDHAGRSTPDEVLEALGKIEANPQGTPQP